MMRPGRGISFDRPLAAVLMLATSISASGCVGSYGNDYLIVIEPRGDTLQRTVTITRFQSHLDSVRHFLSPDLGEDEAAPLIAAYAVKPDTGTHRPYEASGRFTGIPNDVGTFGHFHHERSPLGSSWRYAERLRGMDDADRYLAEQFAVVDSLISLALGWLRFELVIQPEYPRVADHLDRELRYIGRSLVSLQLLAVVESDSLLNGWISMGMEEHPLFILAGIPLLEAEDEPDSEETEETGGYLARARAELARRMGLASRGDQDRVLAFLSNPQAALASFTRYTEASDQVARVKRTPVPMLPGLDDFEVASLDRFTIELVLPDVPVESNGRLDSTWGRVRWQGWLRERAHTQSALPLVCQASWAMPDRSAQERLFGEVKLDRGALIAYNDWYASLEAERRLEWDRMLLSLRPGQFEPLRRFRFQRGRAAPPVDPRTGDLASYPRTILLEALEPTPAPHRPAAGSRSPSRR